MPNVNISGSANTSVAVFVAITVLYFVSIVVPWKYSRVATVWAASATTLTGALATFLVMSKYGFGLGKAGVILACAALVSTLAALAIASCVSNKQCHSALPVHTLLFSSAFVAGAAAYLGFLIGSALGMPLWAAIVLSIVAAPVFVAGAMPTIAESVHAMLDRMT